MARTTDVDVKTVIETGLDSADVQRLIEMANRIVTDQLSGSGLSDSRLKDIETWMTAHLIAVGKERQIASEKVHDVWVTYQGKFGDFLRSTSYGQVVLSLDSSGSLDAATKKKARFRAMPQYPENYE